MDYTSTVEATTTPIMLQGGDRVAVTGKKPAMHSGNVYGTITVQNGGIYATNLNGTSQGIITVDAAGGVIDIGTGSILIGEGYGTETGTIGSTGIYTYGANSLIRARNVTITVTSDDPYGAYTRNSSTINLTGLSTISVTGRSVGPSGPVRHAYALASYNSGILNAENVNVTIAPAAGNVIPEAYAAWTTSQGLINVAGNLEASVKGTQTAFAYSSGTSSEVKLNNVSGTSTATGGGAYALYSSSGARIAVSGAINGQVSSDTSTVLVRAGSNTAISWLGGGTVSGTGPTGGAILMDGNASTIDVANIKADFVGQNSGYAINSSITSSGGSTINVTNSVLSSNYDGIVISSGTLNLNMNSVTLNNGSGNAIVVNDAKKVQSVLNLNAVSSHFKGIATTGSNSLSNLALTGSDWLMTGNSEVTSIANNASTITFAPAGASAFKTLSVTNYTGAGGNIVLNTVLGGTGSPSDRLVILNGGSASGTTNLFINQVGGTGSQIVGDGILVVEAQGSATTTTSAFRLGQRVAAGAYEYSLVRGGSASADSWYLTDRYVGEETGGGFVPDENTEEKTPNYRAEMPLAMAMPPVALEYGYSVLGTLHERIGDPRPNPLKPVYEERVVRGKKGKLETVRVLAEPTLADEQRWFSGGWARVIGDRGIRDNNNFKRRGPDYNYTFGAVQVGMDIYGRQSAAGDLDKAGVYFAYGNIDTDVKRASNKGNAGSVLMDAYTIGAYWTHIAAAGWYTDAVVQGTWYSTDAKSIYGPRLKPDGFGFLASLEGGYSFKLDNGWIIEPQAQIAYQRVSFDSVSDAYGRFKFDDGESVRGRIGVRFSKDWEVSIEGKPRLITTWLRANIWHEFGGKLKTTATDIYGLNSVTLGSSLQGTWGEIGAGISGQVADQVSLFGTAAYNHSLDNKGRESWNGRLGVVVKW
ncbi:autotransporter outer membrane beta-barrel domain-containing protein [Microvirga sp. W0021]|uniref:Autotransporter outer membrane beta-barrel domain-containing protein n=1 Tax=Hohaiivirga grylli TaxID=3133970 RepID=A0ABV0BJM1_9HYPH